MFKPGYVRAPVRSQIYSLKLLKIIKFYYKVNVPFISEPKYLCDKRKSLKVTKISSLTSTLT